MTPSPEIKLCHPSEDGGGGDERPSDSSSRRSAGSRSNSASSAATPPSSNIIHDIMARSAIRSESPVAGYTVRSGVWTLLIHRKSHSRPGPRKHTQKLPARPSSSVPYGPTRRDGCDRAGLAHLFTRFHRLCPGSAADKSPFFSNSRTFAHSHLSLEGRKRGLPGVDDDVLTRRDHAHWMRHGTLHLVPPRSEHRGSELRLRPRPHLGDPYQNTAPRWARGERGCTYP